MAKATEVARLTVDGRDYTEWETVSVKLELYGNPPQSCRFTCSEGSPLAQNWFSFQILPGMKCSVYLAGQLAFNGTVISRQVFVDGRRHHIEIQCANNLELSTASVITKTGEFKNQNPEQIIRSVLAGVGKSLAVLGGQLPNITIPRVSVTPGISIIDFIDNLTRHLAAASSITIAHSATPAGQFAIVVGPYGGSDAIIEGQNMLEGREIIYIPLAYAEGGAPKEGGDTNKQSTLGQRPGDDNTWGAAVAHVPFLSNAFQMISQIVPTAIVAEMPLWNKALTQGRATAEKGWMNQDFVTVYGTLQGWLRPSGGLWVPGQDVIVTSPMLVMDGDKLTLKSVTFTQDLQKGTRSVLECCNANAMGNAPKAGQ